MKFKVVSNEAAATVEPSASDPSARISELIGSAPVYLFMKGNPGAPQCGFSSKVIGILGGWGVPFKSFDVLSDQAIREGVKSFSNWPTIPQLYINKEFVGGCDIITELSETGELLDVLKEALPDMEFTPPKPPAVVKKLTVEEAAKVLAENTEAKLLDVRGPDEYSIAHVEGAILLDQDIVENILDTWDPETPVLLMCHHGHRSMQASNFFTHHGFQNVSNIEGGIDAWAETIDTSLERY